MGELIVGLVITATTLAAVAVIAWASCGSRWEYSGLKTSWGPIKGCLVQMPDGRWLPDDRVREIDIGPKKGA